MLVAAGAFLTSTGRSCADAIARQPGESGMSDTLVHVETPRQKLAQSARQDDMKAANDGARAAAQTSIIINGGSGTAIVALISNYVAKGQEGVPFYLLFAASLSLFVYAVGVSLGSWSMWCASQASAQFGLKWETFLDTNMEDTEEEETDARKDEPPKTQEQKIADWKKNKKNAQKRFFEEGEVWLGKHRRSFALSILSFIVASGVMAIGLALSVQVAPLTKSLVLK